MKPNEKKGLDGKVNISVDPVKLLHAVIDIFKGSGEPNRQIAFFVKNYTKRPLKLLGNNVKSGRVLADKNGQAWNAPYTIPPAKVVKGELKAENMVIPIGSLDGVFDSGAVQACFMYSIPTTDKELNSTTSFINTCLYAYVPFGDSDDYGGVRSSNVDRTNFKPMNHSNWSKAKKGSAMFQWGSGKVSASKYCDNINDQNGDGFELNVTQHPLKEYYLGHGIRMEMDSVTKEKPDHQLIISFSFKYEE